MKKKKITVEGEMQKQIKNENWRRFLKEEAVSGKKERKIGLKNHERI